jgi:hypothetical protein
MLVAETPFTFALALMRLVFAAGFDVSARCGFDALVAPNTPRAAQIFLSLGALWTHRPTSTAEPRQKMRVTAQGGM